MSEHAEVHPPPSNFFRKYVFSTDHKVIGKQYMSLALFWMIIGALTVVIIRWQLAWPGTPLPGSNLMSEEFWEGESWLAQNLGYGIVESQFFNKMFTMHGTIMVFFEVSNLMNRDNICCFDYDLETDENDEEFLDYSPDYWLPLLPAVGFLWEF